MALGLLNLPTECLVAILSKLRTSHIRSVALTFNRLLFKLAKPMIDKHLTKIKDDEAYLESIYGKIKLGQESDSDKLSRHLEYLDFNGDMEWYDDWPSQSDDRPPDEWWPIEEEDFDKLIKTTTRLGLTLPPAFIYIFRKQRHHKFFVSSDHLMDERPLTKVVIQRTIQSDNPSHEPETAYLLTFWEDQQNTGEYIIYLGKAGRHAMLSSSGLCQIFEDELHLHDESKLAILTDLEKELGVVQARAEYGNDEAATLEDMNFEHWVRNGAAETITYTDNASKALSEEPSDDSSADTTEEDTQESL